jgi:hypothetical protein
MSNMETQEQQPGQWAIVEIMGRKVVAGYVSQSVQFGLPMLRIDVPATSAFPAFTQEYGAQAIYAITYVSEEVARMTAESNKTNPVSVYVPNLADLQRAKLENDALRQQIIDLRALPKPRANGDGDDPHGNIADEDECPRCGGSGYVELPDGSECDCLACHGTGVEIPF